jgi:hypothetical protein
VADRLFGLRFNLSQSKLTAIAQHKTKLSDFGEYSFQEPLSILLDSMENEAHLNVLGRFMAQQMILTALTNQLFIKAKQTKSPDLPDTAAEEPVFIVGYPRTGTTMLHNLMALDPENRTLKMYEALCPVTMSTNPPARKDPRIDQAEKFIKATYYISRQVPVIHPLNANGPDECLKLIEATFISPHFLLYCQAPKYWTWLLGQGIERTIPVYKYHKIQLQALGKRHEKRWVLKAPIHLFFLDALLQVYPDARIIHLHRDPMESIPSFCSLVGVSRRMGSDSIDKYDIGRFALDLYETSNKRAHAARMGVADPNNILDIQYQDLTDDPLTTISGIYKRLNLDLKPDTERAMADWLTQNPRHKHGVHRYSLETFGLKNDQIEKVAASIHWNRAELSP